MDLLIGCGGFGRDLERMVDVSWVRKVELAVCLAMGAFLAGIRGVLAVDGFGGGLGTFRPNLSSLDWAFVSSYKATLHHYLPVSFYQSRQSISL